MNEPKQQLQRYEGYLATDPDNLELLARVIDLSLEAGDAMTSERYARAGLDRYPTDVFLRARLGSALLAQHRWADAEAIFGTLPSRHGDINLAYNLATALLWQGRYGEAYALLAPFDADPALTAPMATLMVRALHHLGRGEQALEWAERRGAAWRDNPTFLAALGIVNFDAGRLDQAESLANAALAGDDAHTAPLEGLVVAGSLALARTDSVAAVSYFESVLLRAPQEGRSWSGLGIASLLKRDFAAAQEQLEHAVEYMPGHVGSWLMLGWSRMLENNLDGAQAAFDAALRIDRNFGETHGALAVLQARQGLRNVAEASIARAVGLDPAGLSARYAEMVLSGETEDPARFRALAIRLLSSRQGAFGLNLGELVKRQGMV